MKFEELPEELICLIISFIPTGETLAIFASLNSRFYGLAEPFVFRIISLRLDGRDLTSGQGSSPSSRKYFRLLAKVHDQPAICRYVKRLDLKIKQGSGPFRDEHRLSGLMDELQNINTLDLDSAGALYHFATNLPAYTEDNIHNGLFAHAAHRGYLQLLQKDSLKVLILHRAGLYHIQTSPLLNPALQRVSFVTDLRLYAWNIFSGDTPELLKAMTRPIASLKRFHLELKRTEGVHVPALLFFSFSVRQICHAVAAFHATLEELYICASDLALLDQGIAEIVDSLDLSRFSRLKRLAIPIESLLGSTGLEPDIPAPAVLPKTIQKLQIQCSMLGALLMAEMGGSSEPFQQPLCDGMKQFLARAPDQFPRLQRVVWWIQGPLSKGNWTYGYGSELDAIEEAFVTPKFEWLSEPMALDTPLLKDSLISV